MYSFARRISDCDCTRPASHRLFCRRRSASFLIATLFDLLWSPRFFSLSFLGCGMECFDGDVSQSSPQARCLTICIRKVETLITSCPPMVAHPPDSRPFKFFLFTHALQVTLCSDYPPSNPCPRPTQPRQIARTRWTGSPGDSASQR